MTKAAMLMILLVTTMTAAQTATRKTFDVVSIKPHKSIGGAIVLNPEPTERSETLQGRQVSRPLLLNQKDHPIHGATGTTRLEIRERKGPGRGDRN
jgi:hypothetical protein